VFSPHICSGTFQTNNTTTLHQIRKCSATVCRTFHNYVTS